MPIGIVLADDHPIFCQGLKSLLESEGFNVVGAASDGFEAIQLAERLQPDVAILDFSMPGVTGLGAAKEIRRVSPRSKIIILSLHREEQYIVEAMISGVKGYVLKSEATSELIQAIEEVHRGNAFLSPGIAQFTVNSCLSKSAGGASPELLSPRELQVLELVAQGNTTRAIAKRLALTVRTAESYRTTMMSKLGIHEVASLVRYAVRRGLVKP